MLRRCLVENSEDNKTLISLPTLMSKSKIPLLALALCSLLTTSSPAQTTNAVAVVPATILENLEGLTGELIVKGTGPVGSVTAAGAVISATCKEDTLVSANQKAYGLVVDIKFDGQPEDRTVVDYDELEMLLSSVDSLRKLDWSVTSLSSFDVNYTTKAGLRVAAFSSKRAGAIEFTVRSTRMDKGLLLTAQQFAQLQTLLTQAKAKLDSIRKT
jgi:hypothetical protein